LDGYCTPGSGLSTSGSETLVKSGQKERPNFDSLTPDVYQIYILINFK